MVMITGQMIKKMRKEMEITQKELADAIGISQAHVAKIENEKVDPRLSTVNKILSVLQTNKKRKCSKVMSKNIIILKSNDQTREAVKLMKKFGVSQIPIVQNDSYVGSISEKTVMKNLDKDLKKTKIKEIMEEPFPIINSSDYVDVAKSLLDFHQAVLIRERGKVKGIITKSDLMGLLR